MLRARLGDFGVVEVCERAECHRPRAEQERVARGRADRHRRERVREIHPLPCEPVEVRGAHDPVAVDAETVEAVLIDVDEKDVG